MSQARHAPLSLTGKGGASALLGLLLLSACSSTELPPGVITITTEVEPDAWTVEPAAQNVLLEMVQSSGRTTLANLPAPLSSVDIGTEGPSNAEARFEATAFDVDANAVMWGSTVELFVYGFAGLRATVFMGRSGGFSRAPGELIFPRRHPQLATVALGYVLISGGDGAQTDPVSIDVYDLVPWVVLPEKPPLPKVPESWAAIDPLLLLVDHEGAIWVDLTTTLPSAVTAPTGLDFAKIVGGQTIVAPDGTQYIVGGTRTTDEPTNQVLRIDKQAKLTLMRLGTPRLGASAAIVNGQLLVVGGSDIGAGAEISNAAGTGFTPLPFPPDTRLGAAMVAQDETTVVLAGGRDPETDEIAGFRTMDLGCSQDCSQVEIENADFAFDRPQLFAAGEGQLFAVGEQPTTGETQVFTFDTGIGHALTEIALRTPRAAAGAVMLPNGQLAIVGGDALSDSAPARSMELFFP